MAAPCGNGASAYTCTHTHACSVPDGKRERMRTDLHTGGDAPGTLWALRRGGAGHRWPCQGWPPIPMVDVVVSSNRSDVKRMRMHDLPTPESPTSNTCNQNPH